MNESKIIKILEEQKTIDSRGLFCYSNASVATSQNRIVYLKTTTTTMTNNLPRFMLLSICHDRMYIYKVGFGSKPKEMVTFFQLDQLTFEEFSSQDFIHRYCFQLNLGYNNFQDFYIQGVYKKNKMKEVVEAIIAFNQNK